MDFNEAFEYARQRILKATAPSRELKAMRCLLIEAHQGKEAEQELAHYKTLVEAVEKHFSKSEHLTLDFTSWQKLLIELKDNIDPIGKTTNRRKRRCTKKSRNTTRKP